MKFSIEDVTKSCSRKYESRENCISDSKALLKEGNKFVHLLSTFIRQFG
jgi:hypothetical protein